MRGRWGPTGAPAAVEPVLAQRLQSLRESQRQTIRTALVMVTGRAVDPSEADGLWALLGQEVYELLVVSAGWSPARYEQWVAEAVTALLHLHD